MSKLEMKETKMKNKKASREDRKLLLNRETVRPLTGSDLHAVAGGSTGVCASFAVAISVQVIKLLIDLDAD